MNALEPKAFLERIRRITEVESASPPAIRNIVYPDSSDIGVFPLSSVHLIEMLDPADIDSPADGEAKSTSALARDRSAAMKGSNRINMLSNDCESLKLSKKGGNQEVADRLGS